MDMQNLIITFYGRFINNACFANPLNNTDFGFILK